jgi:ribonuclease BN (tRNA processing enzyme)
MSIPAMKVITAWSARFVENESWKHKLSRGKRSKDNNSQTGVPHGDAPTIFYRIELGDVSIAFTSGQNGSGPTFTDFIRGVDFLVIHLAASEDAIGFVAELHAKPSVWGKMATDAGVGHVVVSHISTSSPKALKQSLVIFRNNYSGALTVAEDLMCVELN